MGVASRALFSSKSLSESCVDARATPVENLSVERAAGALTGAVGGATGALTGAVGGAIGALIGAVGGATGVLTGAVGG